MTTTVAFADLRHDDHACNAAPYGAGLVAAYALERHRGRFEAELFVKPSALARRCETAPPRVACFSNYVWNLNLAYACAERLKARRPETIVVFGGPNFPIERDAQETFLARRPAIDFYVSREGEASFSGLLGALFDHDLDAASLKNDDLPLEGCFHLRAGQLVDGGCAPLIQDLDTIPSPYQTGLLDEFLKDMAPMLETTRGCPFSCTFCQDGGEHASKIRRFSSERVKADIDYMAARAVTPQVHVADMNFGMYKQDLDTCRHIADARRAHSWPNSIDLCGKNQKERILEAARIIETSGEEAGVVTIVAAVQSTDDAVLEAIKRKNVRTDEMTELAKESEAWGSSSFSEVILGLPGDTLDAHMRTVLGLMDAGVGIVRSHQFIFLNGAEAATRATRSAFDLGSRFRVAPGTVVRYEMFGEPFLAPEIDEICVSSASLPYADYLKSRQFDLTVEIFYNYGLFQELHKLMRLIGLPISELIKRVHERAMDPSGPLAHIYAGFLRDTEELFETEQIAWDFAIEPENAERYINGELGNNEQLVYRAVAMFEAMDEIHDLAFGAAREILAEDAALAGRYGQYLDELKAFSVLRKRDILAPDEGAERTFHFDFAALDAARFEDDPLGHQVKDGVAIRFFQSAEQQETTRKYLRLYGRGKASLGNLLAQANRASNFYRKVEKTSAP